MAHRLITPLRIHSSRIHPVVGRWGKKLSLLSGGKRSEAKQVDSELASGCRRTTFTHRTKTAPSHQHGAVLRFNRIAIPDEFREIRDSEPSWASHANHAYLLHRILDLYSYGILCHVADPSNVPSRVLKEPYLIAGLLILSRWTRE
jgi:hypothetical protein